MGQFDLLGNDYAALRHLRPSQEKTLSGARRLVSDALSDHRLMVSDDAPLDVELRVAHVGALPFMLLRYGAAVAIEPSSLQGHVLFQIVLRGEIEVEGPGGSFRAGAGDALLLDNLSRTQLRWSSNSQQIIMPIPRSAVSRATGQTAIPVRFDSMFALGETGNGTLELVRYIAALAHDGKPAGMGTSVMDLLVRQLLVHHSDFALANPAIPRCVRRAEEHMRANLQEGMTLADLAGAVQSTPRTLSANFQKFRGISPMSRFRDMRLDAAHVALKDGTAQSVTEAAMTYRFFHLGRFSQVYRERFGEMPHATQGRIARASTHAIHS